MTERTNRLISGNFSASHTPPFVTVPATGEQVPTDIHAYCAWLIAKEKRHGRWSVIEVGGKKTVDWKAEMGTADWLRERGLAK